jgi:hypothetical protein
MDSPELPSAEAKNCCTIHVQLQPVHFSQANNYNHGDDTKLWCFICQTKCKQIFQVTYLTSVELIYLQDVKLKHGGDAEGFYSFCLMVIIKEPSELGMWNSGWRHQEYTYILLFIGKQLQTRRQWETLRIYWTNSLYVESISLISSQSHKKQLQ